MQPSINHDYPVSEHSNSQTPSSSGDLLFTSPQIRYLEDDLDSAGCLVLRHIYVKTFLLKGFSGTTEPLKMF